VRIKVVAGEGAWGPQLVGNVAPGDAVELTTRIRAESPTDNVDASIRFVDAHGLAWVASARGELEPELSSVTTWIDAGRVFAQRDLPPIERGTLAGHIAPPDFDEWASQFDINPK
jgi:hypothetical protein